MDEATGIVYLARNARNGRGYVGKTISGLEQRRRTHLHQAFNIRQGSCRAFHRAIRKHGKGSFYWEILEECPVSELDAAESRWIQVAGTAVKDGGYNIFIGGTSGALGYKHTRAERQRRSERMTGTSPSALARKKISAKLKGRRLSPEHREKIVAALRRRSPAEATRKKIGDAHRGKQIPQEMRDRISETLMGRKPTNEAKAKRLASYLATVAARKARK